MESKQQTKWIQLIFEMKMNEMNWNGKVNWMNELGLLVDGMELRPHKSK